MSLNKKRFIQLIVPLFFIVFIAVFYSYFYQRSYAGIRWPKTTTFEPSGLDVAITLNEDFSAFFGTWPSGTNFFVSNDKIKEIEAHADFTFLDFQFKRGAIITVSEDNIYKMYVKANYRIDGLDLSQECLLQFKNRVLYSAKCPGEEEILFKRFISADSLEFDLEGETKVVE